MNDFRDALYDALLHGLDRLVDSWSGIVRKNILPDVGGEIVEHLQRGGYCTDDTCDGAEIRVGGEPGSVRLCRTAVKLNTEIEKLLREVRALRELFPLCAGCRQIRRDQEYRKRLESYLAAHTADQVIQGLCPACRENMNGELQDWDCRR